MNRNVPIMLVLLMLIVTKIAFAANKSVVQPTNPFSDSLHLKPAFLTHKRAAVKLYPNPTFNGVIKVSAVEDGELYFYVFDLEGTLISQKKLNNKQLHTINHLKKGIYLYDVFRNDESIEQGRIVVK